MLNIEKPDKNHPCNGCHYWRWIGICQACNYSLLTGHLRGCKPGSECTKRIPMDEELKKKEQIRIFQCGYIGRTEWFLMALLKNGLVLYTRE